MSYVLFVLSGLLCYGVGVVLGHRVGRRKEPILLPPPGGDLNLYRTVKRQLDELTRERDEARGKHALTQKALTAWIDYSDRVRDERDEAVEERNHFRRDRDRLVGKVNKLVTENHRLRQSERQSDSYYVWDSDA